MPTECPACGARAGTNVFGPRFRRKTWWRRNAYWRCTWCKFRWSPV